MGFKSAVKKLMDRFKKDEPINEVDVVDSRGTKQRTIIYRDEELKMRGYNRKARRTYRARLRRAKGRQDVLNANTLLTGVLHK